jgi:aryl sulfotransferase
MQRILALLVHQTTEARSLHELSPWIDQRFAMPIDAVLKGIEAQTHRRAVKTHLPFDGIPVHPNVKYIHVARDGRDACMSYFNHVSSFMPEMLERLDAAGAVDMGIPYPRVSSDPTQFWRNWLTKGIRPGVRNGYPTESFFDLENTYWRERHRPNVLLVHYNDLTADLDGEMRRVASFLEIETAPGLWPQLVDAARFASMKRDGAKLMPRAAVMWKDGIDTFLFKGTNGRWRDVIGRSDLELYDTLSAENFTPGLARWVQSGRLETGDPRHSVD